MTPEMVEALSALTGMAREGLLAAAIVFLRVGAAMAVLPAFGEQVVPMRVRLALTLAFTLIVAPAVAPETLALAERPNGWIRALATEVLTGLILGIGLRLFVHALQTAGTMAA